MTNVELITTPLTELHDIRQFDCGIAELNSWLKDRALKNQSQFSQTYVCLKNDQVIGYYALAAGSVHRMSLPANQQRNTPDSIPTFLLARLAVDQNFHGQGIGSDLIRDALIRCVAATKQVAAYVLQVHATNDEAIKFYLRNSFVQSPIETSELFFKLPKIR